MFIQPLPTLGFCDSIKICFQKFCTFSGRARRSEFWLFFLFVHLILVIPMIILFSAWVSAFIEYIIRIFQNIDSYSKNYSKIKDYEEIENFSISPMYTFFTIIIIFLSIVLSIPMISVSIRRLHDTGKSGLYFLLSFVPFGNLILLFFFAEDSQQTPNQYGPSTKYVAIQNGPLMNNSQIIPISNMPNANPQLQILQGFPQQNIYPNMYQQQFPQNIQYIQYPQQYPPSSQQLSIEQNLSQPQVQVVQDAVPNNQARLVSPVVYP